MKKIKNLIFVSHHQSFFYHNTICDMCNVSWKRISRFYMVSAQSVQGLPICHLLICCLLNLWMASLITFVTPISFLHRMASVWNRIICGHFEFLHFFFPWLNVEVIDDACLFIVHSSQSDSVSRYISISSIIFNQFVQVFAVQSICSNCCCESFFLVWA